MHPPEPETITGYANRHDTWHEITAVSSIGRRTMGVVPNYRLLRAATQIDATAASRLLLVHLIGYLGPDDQSRPDQRFVVFPGNTRLSDELRCTPRSIQRQADELESKGFMRRCYNAMNRRTGFDLTPFAMQHEEVVADMVAVHTRRRQEREEAQLELSLEADRISRPERTVATSVSPRGDAGVAPNRTGHIKDDGATIAAVALDAFDWRRAATSALDASFEGDRTAVQHDAVLAHVSAMFASAGRLSSLGWASALQSLGRDRAVALFLVASTDPRRRQSAARYFGWLLRMSSEGTHDVIVEAAGRATAAFETAAAQGTLEVTAARAAATTKRLGDDVVRPRNGWTSASPIGGKDGARPAKDGIAAAGTVRRAVTDSKDAEARERTTTQVVASRTEADVPDRKARAWAGTANEQRIHDAIREDVGPRMYDTWMVRTRCGMEGDDLVVTAPSAFASDWIVRNLAGAIAKGATTRAGREVEVRVRTLS
jgi:hypothetical protein